MDGIPQPIIISTSPGEYGSQMEYLLQGSICETSRDTLLHRLRGLCDNLETGPEMYREHEMVYVMKGTTPPVLFRVRKSLNHPKAPLHLRYVGNAEVGDKSRHTLLRTCLDVCTSDNLVQFLHELGFKLDHEFVIDGYLFRKGGMKVTVSRVYRMQQPGNINNEALETLSQSFLVELSVVTMAGQDQIQDDMKNFAEQLKPLVHLEKIDHRRL